MDRIFLGANVLFSAAYRPDAGLLRLWELDQVDLVTSRYAAEEARLNLLDEAQRRRLNKLLAKVDIIESIPSGPLPQGIKLPKKDHLILLAAIAARATHLLTGDKEHFEKYFGREIGGMLILPPAEYFKSRKAK